MGVATEFVIPIVPLYEICGAPSLPFFVVTRITPPAAREPYTAADASFSTEIDSTDEGSRLLKASASRMKIGFSLKLVCKMFLVN